ncbi:hypothetical protein C348_01474 [Cryptococcus neoformans Gb118]|nr:hypothetical protein C348_01474 [Cryptococcus neoformans var. grubii Gb118]
MSPRYYERHFCNVLTTATLCSRLTIRPCDSAEYTGWTALAMTGHVIFIHPSYSKPFIEHMGEHRPIEPSSDERYITRSSLVVPMLEILQSLEAIDCWTIRVVCYGQKRRITDYSVPSEPAQPEHYKANTNLTFRKGFRGKEGGDWAQVPFDRYASQEHVHTKICAGHDLWNEI